MIISKNQTNIIFKWIENSINKLRSKNEKNWEGDTFDSRQIWLKEQKKFNVYLKKNYTGLSKS